MGLSRHAAPLAAALVLATAVALAGCGSGGSTAPAARPDTDGSVLTALERGAARARRGAYWARVRAAVLRGEARDYAGGTRIGGRAFQACLRAGLREALDPPTITRLAAVYRRPDGPAFAAQALNALAAPIAGRCGHRYWVPELVAAARGLHVAHLGGAAVKRLGVTYGPYLGVRCPRADHPGCGRVGIDVVLRRAATRVAALVGGRRLVLRTPGEHNRVRRHDWVGTLSGADFFRPGSPFYIPGSHRWTRKRARQVWAGNPPVYVPVELRVRFADGRRARARFPRVFVSPGWG